MHRAYNDIMRFDSYSRNGYIEIDFNIYESYEESIRNIQLYGTDKEISIVREIYDNKRKIAEVNPIDPLLRIPDTISHRLHGQLVREIRSNIRKDFNLSEIHYKIKSPSNPAILQKEMEKINLSNSQRLCSQRDKE